MRKNIWMRSGSPQPARSTDGNKKMRHFVRFFLFAAAVLCLSSISFAQTNPRQREGRGAAAPSPTKNLPFDPHDLSGYWIGGGVRFGMGTPAPPMTPWAQARYNAAIPGIGAGANGNAGNPRSKPLGNDPIMLCDPISYPRIMLTAGMYGHQIIQLPKETIWLFDWFYTRRSIWTDGRKLPEDPDPTFYGYSVGHWDGDTFVVESNGFDERSWLDDDGHPHSDEMRLEERYRRPDHDTIELTMAITDPKAYTQPWKSTTMTLKSFQPDQLKDRNAGWEDLREDVCVPSQEAKYKELVREPAATPVQK
jgi:hypothetical protein